MSKVNWLRVWNKYFTYPMMTLLMGIGYYNMLIYGASIGGNNYSHTTNLLLTLLVSIILRTLLIGP